MFGASGRIALQSGINVDEWLECDTLDVSGGTIYTIVGGASGVFATDGGARDLLSTNRGKTFVDQGNSVGSAKNAGAYLDSNGLYMLCGSSSSIVKNLDPTGAWTTVTAPSGEAMNAIVRTDTAWILGGASDGTNAVIYRSTADSPTSFTEISGVANASINGLSYAPNNAHPLAAATSFVNNNWLRSDDDGASWTQGTGSIGTSFAGAGGGGPNNDTHMFVGANAGIFRAVGTVTSLEDVSPTGLGLSVTLADVAYGAGVWVAVGQSVNSYSTVLVSKDNGATWRRVGSASMFNNLYARCVTFDGVKFYIGTDASGNNLQVYRSS